jgi:DNA-binding PadR family transcriptional regulator
MTLHRATALILLALGRGHSYGFEIMDATGLPSGSVYPALRRLEREGWVESRWQESAPDERGPGRPTRRVYTLTRAGEARVEEARVRLAALVGAARELLRPERPR